MSTDNEEYDDLYFASELDTDHHLNSASSETEEQDFDQLPRD